MRDTSMLIASPPLSWPYEAHGLRLRALREDDDFSVFFGYRSDPHVARFQGWWPMNEARARAFLREQAARNGAEAGHCVQWAIADAATDRLFGDLGVWLSHDRSQAEFGITIAPSVQGRGIGRRALRAAAEWLFADPALTRIRADADARNIPSRRMLLAAGFRETGTAHVFVKEEACVEHRYSMERAQAVDGLVRRGLIERGLEKPESPTRTSEEDIQ